jgi:hypothetical protein
VLFHTVLALVTVAAIVQLVFASAICKGGCMRTAKSGFAQVVILFFLSATSLWAQFDVHDWTNVKNIAPGSDIWIQGTHGNVSGAFESADDDAILVREWRRKPFLGGSYSRPRTIPHREVRQVRFAKRRLSAFAGAAIGAGIATGIGAGLDAQSRSNEDRHLVTVVLGFFGGLIGEGVGEHTAFLHGAKIYAAK